MALQLNPPPTDISTPAGQAALSVWLERTYMYLSRVTGSGSSGPVTSFNTRTGAVTGLAADYDAFFLTPAEGAAAYQPLNANLTAYAVAGNAATVTAGVYITGSYANPAWLTSLDIGKCTVGATLPANVLASSLTSVGRIASLEASTSIDLYGQFIKVGGDNGAWTTRTNATSKNGFFVSPHYTNAQAAVTAFFVSSVAAASSVNIGGGSSAFNAATAISFSTAANNTTTAGTVRMAIDSSGNATFGTASTNTFTMTGRMVLRSVTDAGPMTATAGTVAEIVYNTSDSKFYGCTVTGTPATWAALN